MTGSRGQTNLDTKAKGWKRKLRTQTEGLEYKQREILHLQQLRDEVIYIQTCTVSARVLSRSVGNE